MTKKYIGTKIVTAWRANDKNDRAGYGVIYEDGYQSWSPKEAFEAAYRAVEGDAQALTFGDAIHMLKIGKRVARAGWNGKGMWLALILNIHDIPRSGTNMPVYRLTLDDAGVGATALPWIGMKTADNKFVPWLASQTDMLADDWVVVQ